MSSFHRMKPPCGIVVILWRGFEKGGLRDIAGKSAVIRRNWSAQQAICL